jgi:hypothetical protein
MMAPGRRNRDKGRQASAGCGPGRVDRTARFLARLDDHLPTLADDAARRAFVDRQLAGWECRYARFVATEGASEPVTDPADPPQAADFLLTITGLAARSGGFAVPCHPKGATTMANADHPMPAAADAVDKPLGSAILSLLVAADQRCPAIIGQAHLLYHARFSTAPEHAARTFTQLKRDADDLIKAIADVEAAVKGAKRW